MGLPNHGCTICCLFVHTWFHGYVTIDMMDPTANDIPKISQIEKTRLFNEGLQRTVRYRIKVTFNSADKRMGVIFTIQGYFLKSSSGWNHCTNCMNTGFHMYGIGTYMGFCVSSLLSPKRLWTHTLPLILHCPLPAEQQLETSIGLYICCEAGRTIPFAAEGIVPIMCICLCLWS